jgi:hypothetical protein
LEQIGDGTLGDQDQCDTAEFLRDDPFSLLGQASQLSKLLSTNADRALSLYKRGIEAIRVRAHDGDPRSQRSLGRHYLGRYGDLCLLAEPDHVSTTKGSEVDLICVNTLGPIFLDSWC